MLRWNKHPAPIRFSAIGDEMEYWNGAIEPATANLPGIAQKCTCLANALRCSPTIATNCPGRMHERAHLIK